MRRKKIKGLDAMADRVRLAMVRRLHQDDEPAPLEELAEAAEVHPNTARPHVAALEEAGVVERHAEEPHGRGRPRVRYRLADGFVLPTTDLRELAGLLAAIIQRGARSAGDRQAVAHDWGRYLTGAPGARPFQDAVAGTLEALGADARVRRGHVDLRHCPCPIVSPDDPLMVCDLLVAAADGALQTCAAPVRAGTRRHDPERRRCRVALVAAESDTQP